MKKFFTSIIGMSLLAILITIVACVDINDQNIYLQDYGSEVRFVNLSPLGTANADLIDINMAFGSLDPGEFSEYKEIPSGSRDLKVVYPDTFWVNTLTYTDTTLAYSDSILIDTTFINDTTFTLDTTYIIFDTLNIDTVKMVIKTDKKSTVFILADTSGVRSYVNCSERYIFSPPGISDSALVRVINGLPEGYDIAVYAEELSDPVDVDILEVEDISYKATSGYKKLQAGEYLFSITANAITLSSDTLSFLSEKRYTVAVYDNVTVFEDD